MNSTFFPVFGRLIQFLPPIHQFKWTDSPEMHFSCAPLNHPIHRYPTVLNGVSPLYGVDGRGLSRLEPRFSNPARIYPTIPIGILTKSPTLRRPDVTIRSKAKKQHKSLCIKVLAAIVPSFQIVPNTNGTVKPLSIKDLAISFQKSPGVWMFFFLTCFCGGSSRS